MSSYYPQAGSDPHGRSGAPQQPSQQPLSANDPYHQPGAPRPQWQQGEGYPGSAYPGYGYPGVADPYYPGNTAPPDDPALDDDDDHEPTRRFSSGWLVAIAIGVVTLIIGITVLQHVGSDTKPDDKSAADNSQGTLTEQWSSGDPVSMWSSTLVGQMLVAIECNQRAGPHADGGNCALRGRGLADGQQRWELTDQPLGVALTAVGDVVVVSGDGLRGDLSDNNAGNEQAHRRTLLVDSLDGRVIKAFDNQIAWLYSQRTVVLRDFPSDGGRQTFTAVDAASGQQRWKFDNARPVDDGVNELAALLPDGFAPTPLFYGETAVMDGEAASVVRELDTGKDLLAVPRQPGNPTRYVAYLDDVLVRTVPGSEVRLEGVSTGNLDTPIWSTELGADALPRRCSTMVCVSSSQGSMTRLVNPETGKVIATNDRGAMYVRRSGDVVALLRCDAGGSLVDPCPLDKAGTEVVDAKTGRQVWRGKVPVSVLSATSDAQEKLLIATTSPGSDSIEVVAVLAGSRPVKLGSLKRPGLVKAAEVQNGQVITGGGYEPSFLPTLSCDADGQRLVCGTRWQLSQVVSWRLSS